MIARPASRMPAPGRISGRTRAGFTLIELMGVILIIAILIAIALPAFSAVLRNARITTARTEMAAIGTAIGEFKAEFGTEPPSYISFVAARPAALPAGTKATLRKMFPQIGFTSGAIQTSLTQAGVWGKELRSGEALVFFLGGVRRFDDLNGNGARDAGEPLLNELSGFSKNPANPFAPQTAQSTRLGPFFEFDSGRLVDTDSNELLEYVDKLPGQSKPMLYVSTAGTGFYRVDVATRNSLDVRSGLQFKPYQKNSSTTSPSYYNPNSFQLISAGFDTEYGEGGVVSESSPAKEKDADNITNFSQGLLGDE